jgi:hypothetical protein
VGSGHFYEGSGRESKLEETIALQMQGDAKCRGMLPISETMKSVFTIPPPRRRQLNFGSSSVYRSFTGGGTVSLSDEILILHACTSTINPGEW